MIEGIIQKIIKEIVLDQPATWYHRTTFITLESKLIEEIKKLPTLGGATYNYDWIRRDKIIGDNQE